MLNCTVTFNNMCLAMLVVVAGLHGAILSENDLLMQSVCTLSQVRTPCSAVAFAAFPKGPHGDRPSSVRPTRRTLPKIRSLLLQSLPTATPLPGLDPPHPRSLRIATHPSCDPIASSDPLRGPDGIVNAPPTPPPPSDACTTRAGRSLSCIEARALLTALL